MVEAFVGVRTRAVYVKRPLNAEGAERAESKADKSGWSVSECVTGDWRTDMQAGQISALRPKDYSAKT